MYRLGVWARGCMECGCGSFSVLKTRVHDLAFLLSQRNPCKHFLSEPALSSFQPVSLGKALPLRNGSWYQSVICFLAHSFLVGDDGRVYEGVSWNIQGSHDQGYNNISLGIAFFGAQEGNGTSADCPSKGSLEALLPSQASPQSQFLLHFLLPWFPGHTMRCPSSFCCGFLLWLCRISSSDSQASLGKSCAPPSSQFLSASPSSAFLQAFSLLVAVRPSLQDEQVGGRRSGVPAVFLSLTPRFFCLLL